MEQKKFISYDRLTEYDSLIKNTIEQKSDETLSEAQKIIYVGDGNIPDEATVQFIMDAVDEEQALKDDLKDYIDTKIQTMIDNGEISSPDTPIEVSSWSMVQQLVRLGVASKVFEIGDQLTCQCNGETLVWDIIGIDHDIPVDEKYTHSLTIQLHDCFNDMTFSFDAAEPTNPDTDRALKGSNNWIESNIRQWLNSNKSANNWFEPQTEYDTAPHYANIDGFLCGMDVDFVSVLGEVSKTTQLSDSIDGGIADSIEKVFLLSMTEAYCGGTEGAAYEYYISASSVGKPGEGADDARIKHYSNGAATGWWLRSANKYTSGKIRPVGTSGDITWTDAYLNRLGVAPACCII